MSNVKQVRLFLPGEEIRGNISPSHMRLRQLAVTRLEEVEDPDDSAVKEFMLRLNLKEGTSILHDFTVSFTDYHTAQILDERCNVVAMGNLSTCISLIRSYRSTL